MATVRTAAALFDPVDPPRYCVGIDLGTTNCAVSFIDSATDRRQIEIFAVPQATGPQTYESLRTLPSFIHLSGNATDAAGPADLPGVPIASGERHVGRWARVLAAETPGRVVHSAKSWLCHAGVDRLAAILPWHADPGVAKISPVDAAAIFLEHIRRTWDTAHPDHPLAAQSVVVTLPASFDETARELTLRAAEAAGLTQVLLIEEPQSAFYAWLAEHADTWRKIVCPGQSILVCDIGGGTTDFTLIRVFEQAAAAGADKADPLEDSEGLESGRRWGLQRVAVGEHLLLGGDNFDLTLAEYVERRIVAEGRSSALNARQFDRLRAAARDAKEQALAPESPDRVTIFVGGSGRSLLGGSLQAELPTEEVRSLLLDGFFPLVGLQRSSPPPVAGFQEFGLPYASDPAITGHLASFLWQHRDAGREMLNQVVDDDVAAARVDWVLFNGGVTASPAVRQRVLEALSQWFAGHGDPPAALADGGFDLAVARGAAYFALLRRGQSLGGGGGEAVQIDSRLPRTYYLQVRQHPPQVMCIMPASAATLQRYTFAETPLQVQIGVPVQLPIYASTTRQSDPPGAVLDLDEQAMTRLPAVQTVIQGRSRKRQSGQAVLAAALSELGTLQLALQTEGEGGLQEYRLEFDLRSRTGSGASVGAVSEQAAVDVERVELAANALLNQFRGGKPPGIKKLIAGLVESVGLSKSELPASMLRQLWQAVLRWPEESRSTPESESRWLSLCGYLLRPGFGVAADDWRVAQCWRQVYGRIKHPTNLPDSLVLWRRIAGGFTAGQQTTLLQEFSSQLSKSLAHSGRVDSGRVSELIRLLASLELIESSDKLSLISQFQAILLRPKLAAVHAAAVWGIGRLAARQPLYGPINTAISAESLQPRLESILSSFAKAETDDGVKLSAVVQLARLTGDRYRDLPNSSLSQAERFLKQLGATDPQLEPLRRVLTLADSDRSEQFGEALPLGLTLM